MQEVRHNHLLHRIALLTACATFPLIFLGGLVTSRKAGMSVPDWPNSYGYNMFLFPPRLWQGGILYEHTHRLYAAGVVGPLTIVVALVAWFTERRRWVRWLGVGMLGFVIGQGVLGGLRVRFNKLDLAIVHACFAQAFFCLSAFMCIISSAWWAHPPSDKLPGLDRTLRWAVIATIAIYLQLVVGACMRHYDAGLAIPDVPLAYGKLLPPMNASQLRAANHQRVWETPVPGRPALEPVTLGQIWIHFAHRIGAMMVTVLVLALGIRILGRHRDARALALPAVMLIALLIVQLTLGVLTVVYRKPADIATAHVAAGALTLVTSFVIAVRASRLHDGRSEEAAECGFVPARRTLTREPAIV